MKSSRTTLPTSIGIHIRNSLVVVVAAAATATAESIRDRGDYDDDNDDDNDNDGGEGFREDRMATRRPRLQREEALHLHTRRDLAHLPRHLKILVGFFIAALSLLVVLGLVLYLRRRWGRLFGWWWWLPWRRHEEYRDVESNRNSTLSSPAPAGREEPGATGTGGASPTSTIATAATVAAAHARLDSEKALAGPGGEEEKEEPPMHNRDSTATQRTSNTISRQSTMSRAARALQFARRRTSSFFFSPIQTRPLSRTSTSSSPKTADFAPTLTLELPPPTISWGTYEPRLCDSPTATIPFSDVSEQTNTLDGDLKPHGGKRHSVQSQNSGVSLISNAESARVSLAQVAARPANRPRIRVIGGG